MSLKIIPEDYGLVLKYPNFRRIWLADAVSVAGNILSDIALLWLVAEEYQSALAVGSIVISSSLAYLILGLVGGVFADRFERRKILIYTDLLRAVCVISIPLLYALGGLSIPVLLIINFARAALAQFFNPAQNALIPSTVPRDLLATANSVDQSTSMLMAAISPTLAGVLILVFGPISVFFVDAITFIISALFLVGLKIEPKETNESPEATSKRKNIWIELKDGVTYIFQHPVLKTIALVNVINIFGFGPYRPIALIYFQDDLGLDATQYGLIESIAFLGLAVGLSQGGRIIKRLRAGKTYLLGLLIMGATTVAISSTPWLLGIYVLSFTRMLGNGFIVVTYTTLLQLHSPEEKRGRVFGTMDTITDGGRPLAIAVGTGIAEATTQQFAIFVSGFMFIVSAFVGFISSGFRNEPDTNHEHRETP
jgi:MFS family permease